MDANVVGVFVVPSAILAYAFLKLGVPEIVKRFVVGCETWVRSNGIEYQAVAVCRYRLPWIGTWKGGVTTVLTTPFERHAKEASAEYAAKVERALKKRRGVWLRLPDAAHAVGETGEAQQDVRAIVTSQKAS